MNDSTLTAASLRSLVGRLSRRLRASAPPGDLTWSQVAVLGYLVRDGAMTVTELADAERVRTQSMGATVASLQASGMVTGEPDPNDGRKTRYHATEACLALVSANRAMRDDWLLQAMESQLSQDEQRQLTQLVPLLQKLADYSS
ncbi:MarR family winged helix-turn-helix transcriptional regulator [Mangrovibacter plantisponsor]|uniref:MarR family transcriptional regulator n=1 Tax=Mangrovibacter plantisponsor TaxID=451513 RepID=A0A317Q4S4_9ENTR|nr:MarR family transcriptional regulator [Mangrovibacter plantisponsor]PWW09147.1 MarR family transcriptional regulator [Mangrovibacter plantisponsor]